MELYPRGFWARGLFSLLSPEHYRRVERFAVARAGGRCEFCRGAPRPGEKPLAAHGRWEVNDVACRIRLRRVMACCTDCSLALNMARRR